MNEEQTGKEVAGIAKQIDVPDAGAAAAAAAQNEPKIAQDEVDDDVPMTFPQKVSVSVP